FSRDQSHRSRTCAAAGWTERSQMKLPLSALRGLDDHHVIVMACLSLQAFAAHADFVAHKFISELERVQPVRGNGAIAKSDDRAAKNALEFILHPVARICCLAMRT